jgi:hypothetical protein
VQVERCWQRAAAKAAHACGAFGPDVEPQLGARKGTTKSTTKSVTNGIAPLRHIRDRIAHIVGAGAIRVKERQSRATAHFGHAKRR